MTIAGVHTVHELADLRAAYLQMLQELYVAAQLSTPAWRAADAAASTSTYAAFSVMQSQFNAALAAIDSRVVAALGSADASTVPSWDDVRALDLGGDVFEDYVDVWRGGVMGNPGFGAMNRAYSAARKAYPSAVQLPDSQPLPQPTAPDFDLGNYKLADGAVKWVERNIVIPGTGLLELALVVAGFALVVSLARSR